MTTTDRPGLPATTTGGTAEASSHSASDPFFSARTVPRATRSITCPTWIDTVMWWMNAKNIATLARTSTNAVVTDSWGTKGFAPPRTSRSTTKAKRNEEVKTPSVTWVIRLPRNVPSSRGVNWLLASCMTTIVIVKTRPVSEISRWRSCSAGCARVDVAAEEVRQVTLELLVDEGQGQGDDNGGAAHDRRQGPERRPQLVPPADRVRVAHRPDGAAHGAGADGVLTAHEADPVRDRTWVPGLRRRIRHLGSIDA